MLHLILYREPKWNGHSDGNSAAWMRCGHHWSCRQLLRRLVGRRTFPNLWLEYREGKNGIPWLGSLGIHTAAFLVRWLCVQRDCQRKWQSIVHHSCCLHVDVLGPDRSAADLYEPLLEASLAVEQDCPLRSWLLRHGPRRHCVRYRVKVRWMDH